MATIRDAVREVEQAHRARAEVEASRKREKRLLAEEGRIGAEVRDVRCGCGECPVCRPEVAAAAEVTGLEFLQVLVYVQQAERVALDRLIDLRAPASSRAHRRRQERFRAKRPR